MRPVLICPADLLEHFLGGTAFPGERPVYLVDRASLRARISRRGDRAQAGDLDDPTFYRQALKAGRAPVVVGARPAQFARIVTAVGAAVPDATVRSVSGRTWNEPNGS